MTNFFGAVAFLVFFVVSDVCCASIFVPPGLLPGDEYHLAFVTSGTRDATSGNISDYNAFVQSQSEIVGAMTENYGINWSAIASTSTVHARDNALVEAPVYLLSGTKIADSFSDIWDGALDSPHNLNIDQFGNSVALLPDGFVWTGTFIDGFSFGTPSFPGDRYLGAPEFAIQAVTVPPSPYDQWIASSSQPITVSKRLYALSQKITVVPEPTTCTLVLAALCLPFRRHR